MKSSKAIGLNFLRSAALAAVGATCFVSAAQCFSWEDLNPFAGAKYEMKVDPDVPVDRLYNEALMKLDK